MNRTLFACLALALPAMVAAAPCAMPPHANQCQGSNLWPVPAGWTADNDGDCQPQSPAAIPAVYGYYVQYGPGGLTESTFGATPEASVARMCAQKNFSSCGLANVGEIYSASNSPTMCNIAVVPTAYWWEGTVTTVACGIGWPIVSGYSATINSSSGFSRTWGCANPEYPQFRSGPYLTCTNTYCCVKEGPTTKPSDGNCAGRWTSSAKTALEKDPLDPDCDANSCVLDGTCSLHP